MPNRIKGGPGDNCDDIIPSICSVLQAKGYTLCDPKKPLSELISDKTTMELRAAANAEFFGGYPDPLIIKLESNEAVGTLERAYGKPDGRLLLRDFTLGGDNRRLPHGGRIMLFTEDAERQVEELFGDVESRLNKQLAVRTDEGRRNDEYWLVLEVYPPEKF